jgi:tetratricopeptide (TPR) repeat protein
VVKFIPCSSIVLTSCFVIATGASSISVAIAAPAKPLVVIFSSPTENKAPVAGIKPTEQSPDGLLDAQRTQIAARSVRDRFSESTVAEAVLYNPESPIFARAILESKLPLKDPEYPSESERLALGKATGAFSVVIVRAQSIKDKPGSVEVVLESTVVDSKKKWSDTVKASGGSVLATLPGEVSVEGGSKSTPVDNTAWMTVSNTLVLRYLAGPLGEYTRALAPPGIVKMPTLPPPVPTVSEAAPTPLPVTTPVTTTTVSNSNTAAPSLATPTANLTPVSTGGLDSSSAAQELAVQTARQQAEAFTKGGDLSSAVVVLRKAVNQAPRSLALRASLAKAYFAVGRTGDAASEARRALTVTTPGSDRASWAEMTRVLAGASTQIGDNKAAREAYEEIIKAQPEAYWARLDLGDLLLTQGDTAGAEAQYRTVRQADPNNRIALLSVARVLVARGDYTGAIAEVSNNTGGTAMERLGTNSVLFDEIALKTADSVTQNRQAFSDGQLTREAVYKATQAQSARVDSLLALLRSSPPPPEALEGLTTPYRHRVAAAALLSQAVGCQLSFLESDDKKAGEQAKLLLVEFRKELAAASG